MDSRIIDALQENNKSQQLINKALATDMRNDIVNNRFDEGQLIKRRYQWESC
jgi:hypothetical protein